MKHITLTERPVASDSDAQAVLDELERMSGGVADLRAVLASSIRASLDQSYAGATTGRFHLYQLSKTEKAHTGTLFEIEVQSRLDLPDGVGTDYQVLQFDVDAKFTHCLTNSPSWMIGPEIDGKIALLACADDYRGIWSAWIVWVRRDRRNGGNNRDSKTSLNEIGRAARLPIAVDLPLPPNPLLNRPSDAFEVMRLSGPRKGQARVDLLCQLFDGELISRATAATVAKQLDPTKRFRSNGGARTRLAGQGIVVAGYEHRFHPLLDAFQLPRPSKGEFMAVRVVRTTDSAGATFLDDRGVRWRRALRGEEDTCVPALG